MRVNFLKLIVSLIICQLAGFVGSLFTTPAIPEWYASLQKPSFTPPNWLFSPVWISLFLLMGVSLYLLWQTASKKEAKLALVLFSIQLILNVLWSAIFFGLKSPMVAFIEILVLWAAIFLTMTKSLKVTKAAGYLLLPYIIWVSFAAVLNFFLWKLN
ncbi:MAG: tryptophan-rich sensory protein [Candidatus Aminicenantes bacterium]|nr:tryptophan-rich sensory protein [Candidatus Aminicenantes bacterium]MDH5383442.1 tryptophan-rich sensory protein [Candidatus Aminicenantes bacterium]MDH5745212.1 tryptophan-rich sensory protein [Candidatus Aminicenantes bacterium]